jgi:hypothetical protein
MGVAPEQGLDIGARAPSTYGRMYGMTKTTIYLPEQLKEALERKALVERRTEADVIREALEVALRTYQAPEPVFPIFESDEVTGRGVDELMSGFGED